MASLQHSSNAPAFTVHIWFLLHWAISEGYKNAATKTHRRSMASVSGSRQRGPGGGGGCRETGRGGAPDQKLWRNEAQSASDLSCPSEHNELY